MKGKIVDVHPVALKLQKKKKKRKKIKKWKAVNTKDSVKEREKDRQADRGTDRPEEKKWGERKDLKGKNTASERI